MGRKKKVLTEEELAEKKRLEKEKEIRRQERIKRKREKLAELERKQQENEEWHQLYEYVKTEIMKYDDVQKLSKEMILRLRGLHTGQYKANNNQESFANYSYEVILNTFIYCKNHELDWILNNMPFNDDMHKFNYVLKVVDNNLNLIYNKMKKQAEEEKKIEKIEVVDLPNYENKYVAKEQHNVSEELEALW